MTSWETVRPYFDRAALVHIATLMPDGGPHVVPVWIGADGEHLVVFMEDGSLKDRNLQRDPRVALSVVHPEHPLDMATVRGRVVERITGDAAMPIVDRLARAYTGEQFGMRSGLVAYRITPDRAWATDHS